MNKKCLSFSYVLTISLTLFVHADNREVPVATNNTFQLIATAFKGMGAVTSTVLAVIFLHACYDAGRDLFLDIQRYINLDEDLFVLGIRELLMQNIKNSATRFLVKAGIAGGLFYITYKLGRSCFADLGLIAKKDPVPSEQKYIYLRKITEYFKDKRGVI
ncbi:hypothetical protein E3J79_02120 [Candidatus Dependentiae bacterium]|nr:MAG: hypothetical protein E3J79_02120 [Candidatus Dependentiae bacterium]